MVNPSDHNPKGLLKFVKGDATNPLGSSNRYIIQIVNDEGKYGAGFSGALSKRWPKVETEYRKWWRERFGKLLLGDIQVIQILSDLVVINMVAQKGIVGPNNPKPIDYKALQQCLSKAGDEISQHTAAVHMPRIGAGLAQGEWSVIEPLIEQELLKRGINVTVYDQG
ncbi:macro domain-containing protein [Candidatus Pacearchaeota archaeon]|jgi:O-acetyl-ADP-ribose deacetylase (regulator of RNase III)|nr:macro domain-containing protein [Candidatus Pacearchaeota archaeon]